MLLHVILMKAVCKRQGLSSFPSLSYPSTFYLDCPCLFLFFYLSPFPSSLLPSYLFIYHLPLYMSSFPSLSLPSTFYLPCPPLVFFHVISPFPQYPSLILPCLLMCSSPLNMAFFWLCLVYVVVIYCSVLIFLSLLENFLALLALVE